MSPRSASIVVWFVWFAMLVGTVLYVVHYGSRVLFLDDISLVDAVEYAREDLFSRLWIQHNEHRIPLPRAIQWSLYALTLDVRTGSYVSIAALAATSAAMIALARRLRGHTSLADVFFPLLWLSTGNCENLLMGFQLSLMIPTAFVCAIVLVTIRDGAHIRPRAALLCSVCLVGLPLCGGPGMLQAPTLALWLVLIARERMRSEDPVARRAGRILLVGVIVTGLVIAAYMIGFHFPEGSTRARDPVRMLDLALRVQALAIGQAAEPWWPASGTFVALVPVSAALLALHAWRVHPGERWRSTAVLVGLATSTALALGIGFGRASDVGVPGFANRYVGLTAPILATSYFGWMLYGQRLASTLVQALLCLVLLSANVLVNIPVGDDYGRYRRQAADDFERDVEAGFSVPSLARSYAVYMDPAAGRFRTMLHRMIYLQLPPFDRYPPLARERENWPMFARAPIEIEGQREPVERRMLGEPALLMPTGTALVFEVPPGARKLMAVFGVPDEAWPSGDCAPRRLRVRAVDPSGQRTAMWSRTLDPEHVEQDRGPQHLDVELPEPRPVRVVIGMDTVDVDDVRCDWIWLRDLKFE